MAFLLEFISQYGKRFHDCVGLIKDYLWSGSPMSVPKYSTAQDVSADKMLKKCTESGSISTLWGNSIEVQDDFFPSANASYFLGTDSRRWYRGCFSDDVYIGGRSVAAALGWK